VFSGSGRRYLGIRRPGWADMALAGCIHHGLRNLIERSRVVGCTHSRGPTDRHLLILLAVGGNRYPSIGSSSFTMRYPVDISHDFPTVRPTFHGPPHLDPRHGKPGPVESPPSGYHVGTRI
jgi:hypothetical protein